MTTFSLLPISITTNIYLKSYPFHYYLPKLPLPIKNFCLNYSKFASFHKTRSNGCIYTSRGFLWGERIVKDKKRVVLVKGLNLNGGGNNKDDGGGGGGGGGFGGISGGALGNLAIAGGLVFLVFNDQLGWVLDTIVSLWLLSIVLPIVGFGLFLWWAKSDVVQSACPNCGNEFQVFKSSLNDELQLCPFCTQPFSVEGNEFVKEPINFSNRSNPFGKAFDGFSSSSGKGKEASTAIVDIEAEVKDVE